MSELTSCNYCDLQMIKKQAKADGLKIIIVPSRFMGGSDIFAVPKSTTRKEVLSWKDSDTVPPNGDENYQKYHKAWMREISVRCRC